MIRVYGANAPCSAFLSVIYTNAQGSLYDCTSNQTTSLGIAYPRFIYEKFGNISCYVSDAGLNM